MARGNLCIRRRRAGVVCLFAICLVLQVAAPAPSPAQSATPAPQRDYWSAYEDAGTTATAPGARKQPGGWGDWLRMLAALAFVVGLIVLLAYLFRRFAPRSIGQGRSDVIRVVATKMLGGRRSLMLVRVRGQTLLLGLTPQAIQCLTEIHDLEGEWAQSPEGAGRKPSAFERQLDRLIEPRPGEKKKETTS